jgi:hypothetical protein
VRGASAPPFKKAYRAFLKGSTAVDYYKAMIVYSTGPGGHPAVTSQLLEFPTYEQAEAAIKAIDNTLRQTCITVIRFYKVKKEAK